MKQDIPLSIPVLGGNEWKYIKECLDTGWVSSVGRFVEEFERKTAEYLGSRYAVATSTGTAALHAALLASGIRPGDEVIVPALTFVATANAVRYCGAEPVFMDCSQDTLCIDPVKTASFLEKMTSPDANNTAIDKITGRPVRAILPVHVFGHPADMNSLRSLSDQYNLTIIEDATESLGSSYKSRKAGTLGSAGCLSFNGNKIITSGGGGMVVTDNHLLAEKVRHLTTQARSDPYEYDHDEIGYNYRLTNMQAALGLAQLEQLDSFIAAKRRNAQSYKRLLSDLDGAELMWEHGDVISNFWYITLKVREDRKNALSKYLISKGIQVRPLWKPLHTLNMYRGCRVFNADMAVSAYDRCINLPASVNLTGEDITYITDQIKDYLRRT